MTTTRKPTIGQRRIRVTFDGSVFTARVEKYRAGIDDDYIEKKTGERPAPAWYVCTWGDWGQGKAVWSNKKLLKAYRKAVAYIETRERLDREDGVVDAFGSRHAEYIEVH